LDFKININLEAFNMRKLLNTVNTVKTLAKDKDGVVSFEYVIVAACVVAAVAAAFGTTTGSGIGAVLLSAITAIGAKVATATSA
jgi:pilus assembly protein Flp/PilA